VQGAGEFESILVALTDTKLCSKPSDYNICITKICTEILMKRLKEMTAFTAR